MKGQILTKTLAELYLQQGHLYDALEIYLQLSEKDPFDLEVQKKILELKEKLSLSSDLPLPPSKEERILLLKKWLSNIRRRRIGQ